MCQLQKAENTYPSILGRLFPRLHFAVILKNGFVKDVLFTSKNQIIIKNLFRLPKSGIYSGFSDDKGILYFFDEKMKKPVTIFHKSLNKEGHMELTNMLWKNKPMGLDHLQMKNSVNFGNFFWFLNASPMNSYLFQIGNWYLD